MRSLRTTLALLVASAAYTYADATEDEEIATTTAPIPACTATSSAHSDAFFDLRPDTAIGVDALASSPKSRPTKDYHAKGWDYGKNFTLNICGPVVEPVYEVVGVEENTWANISAYYSLDGQTYSLGTTSLDLKSRGRKVVLQYTGGSPCGPDAALKRRNGQPATDTDNTPWTEDDEDHPVRPSYDPADSVYHDESDEIYRENNDDDDGMNDEPLVAPISASANVRRKSATISFICDRDPAASLATVSFVGTDPDECAYFFEARSVHACAHAEPHKPGSVGPGSIFGLILVIAVLVYVLGGVFYNRTISHARGWRQLPNYSLWAGIWSFVSVRPLQSKSDLPYR